MREHHSTYGGYSRHRMIDMISSFLGRVNGRISLHYRMIYTHPVAEKVEGFDRHGKANLQMDTLRGNVEK